MFVPVRAPKNIIKIVMPIKAKRGHKLEYKKNSDEPKIWQERMTRKIKTKGVSGKQTVRWYS